ncbi:osmoprotectant transport system substrate-binding protein [Actinacidiphila yanglinensis]|uniref:Osmoprotectant transport system substrate-binding protein n=1 Tax=Actinacidiphila yanglinensis TaxID=310779 RepID=A0A1H6D068_9ACTN|nr:glycine betaine ABC transporter substrate-binding protein [Actinacidiphila yanglinensis]SEG78801.1 osmoprotectant transport system substrate-binding protein [Actinacidiphila yanglinensis]
MGALSLLALSALSVLSSCGLTSGSPLVADVRPGTLGRGKPLKGASLTVTSKNFSENIILGEMIGLVFKAAGASVLDRTNITGSIGAREAVRTGQADAMYEYTGTAWITYLGHTTPIKDPHAQWAAVRDEDVKNGLTWLPPSTLDNTYSLAISRGNEAKYHLRTLSQVAALARGNPKAVSLCVENEFASRQDGLVGMEKAYGMNLPSGSIQKMDAGIIYTQINKSGSCLLGEVYTTDGRIRSMDLTVMKDDRNFFPNYNAAPVIHSKTFDRYPVIAKLLDPISAKLDTAVAQQLNAKVDVDGQDPQSVAKDWLVKEGFLTEG